MTEISEILVVVLVILAFLLLLGGVGVYLLVKLGRKAAGKARQAATRLSTHVNAMGTGDAAEVERLRLDLRREVALTRQAVEQAERQGWGLGDLPRLLADLEAQARVHDDQLGMYAQQRRMSPYVDHATLGRLREHQAKLTAMCARIRADLLGDQVRHTSTGIADLTSRTDLEIEARRRPPDPLDEIDELYRRSFEERREHP
ncbi:hypothetical protein MF672_030275 [Actinomadura sp. ATCC 31491]|uniref:Secreted protein n=1 Tax=Actinomadura luzonensis TaxID=2805427 RepID=A0ABT0G0B6_9ACTN|nr:hypothetical protein [Actinomadura luzonensis]MCK2218045.1 hypothetical protein [Actinomadura luzonensis]